MNTSKYPIRQSRRSLSARTTIWSSFCKVLGTFCEWQLMLPNLKSRCSCISIYIFMYTYMYGWEFNITNYESRNEAAKFRCCTHILHFCPATIRLSHYQNKLLHPIMLVKVLPYCGLSYSPLNYVVQSPCQCGNPQWPCFGVST